MNVISEKCERGVLERRFELETGGGAGGELVPGIHWLPEEPAATHPTVLIGHGGTQHKRAPNVLALARRLVRHLGVGVVALDAPEHGDRITDPAAAEAARRELETTMAGGERLTSRRMKAIERGVPKHVAEWRALIDDLQKERQWADGPFGWWGLSMGCRHGLPIVAEDTRIKAAVLGLFGLRPGSDAGADDLRETAARIEVPVLFMFQWDDELMSRQSGLDLWDAIGSREKTMHINPGGHVQVPGSEYESFERFFARHLTR